jgi:hypothetical protein
MIICLDSKPGAMYPSGLVLNADMEAWMVPDDVADHARALVPATRERSLARSRSYGRYSNYVSNVARFSSGAVVYTNKRGRCEDAPCCGCCS